MTFTKPQAHRPLDSGEETVDFIKKRNIDFVKIVKNQYSSWFFSEKLGRLDGYRAGFNNFNRGFILKLLKIIGE